MDNLTIIRTTACQRTLAYVQNDVALMWYTTISILATLCLHRREATNTNPCGEMKLNHLGVCLSILLLTVASAFAPILSCRFGRVEEKGKSTETR